MSTCDRTCHARRPGGPDGGAVTISHVITIPIIVVVTLIAVQLAVVWMAHNAVAAAAQNGISAAREYGSSPAAGQSATAEYLAQTAPGLVKDPDVVITRDGDLLTITVTASAYAVVPFLTWTIQASESGPIEQAVVS